VQPLCDHTIASRLGNKPTKYYCEAAVVLHLRCLRSGDNICSIDVEERLKVTWLKFDEELLSALSRVVNGEVRLEGTIRFFNATTSMSSLGASGSLRVCVCVRCHFSKTRGGGEEF
jgi:hypothetical protein